ncbi:MAG TPA: carbohydrate ABC transporter permease [Chloroflexota bacterium]|nr:carbohydrate ABC transporter permease [Chloroflexota bacterium]
MVSQRVSTTASRAHRRIRISQMVIAFLIVIVGVIIVFPIYWMILSTIQPYKYTLVYSPSLFLRGIDLSPFHNVFLPAPGIVLDLGPWLWNSAQVALMVTFICLVLSLPGAYTLSKLKWKAKPAFGFFILLTQMMPGAIIIVPILRIYRTLNLINNLPALAFVQAAFALPICIWILKNVFDSVPVEVIESALIEGCGQMGVLRRIMVPLSIPGLVAVCVVAFFFSWNEFLFASTFITPDSGLLPGTVGLSSLIGQFDTPIQLLLAAGLIFALPPVVFYILIQRYMIAGLTAGAVKG